MHQIHTEASLIFSAPHRVIGVVIIISMLLVFSVIAANTNTAALFFNNLLEFDVFQGNEEVKGLSTEGNIQLYNAIVSCIKTGLSCDPSYDLNNNGLIGISDLDYIFKHQ